MGFLNLNQIENKFLDIRNRDLWNYLSEKYTIGVNDEYSFYKLDYLDEINPVYILTDKSYSKSLFTHELLHLELRSFGFDASQALPESYLLMNSDVEKFRSQIAYNLANNIEHIIFLKRYKELGFPMIEFVSDYYTSNYSENFFAQFNYIKLNPLLENIYDLFFLSSYITMYSELKNELNRGVELGKLLEINSELYSKVNYFGNFIEELNPYLDNKAQTKLKNAIGELII